MTNVSIPSAIADTLVQCPSYPWCELDHEDPDIIAFAPGTHERHVEISEGDVHETFLLVVRDNEPRMECDFDGGEVWLAPGESTNTFLNIAAVFSRAASLYEAFVEDNRLKLRRHSSVTAELADRDV